MGWFLDKVLKTRTYQYSIKDKTKVRLSIAWSAHKMEFDGDVMKSGRAGANDRSDFHIVAKVPDKTSVILCTLYHTTNWPQELKTDRKAFILPEARLLAKGFYFESTSRR